MATKKKIGPKPAGSKKAPKSPLADNPFNYLKLVSIRLLGLNVSLEIGKGESSLERVELEGSVGVGPSHDGKHIFVSGFLTAKVLPLEKDNSESHALIQSHLQCVYELRGLTPEEFEPISQPIAASSMMAMWPHFREIIQSNSSRMGIAPVVLSMLIPGHPLGGLKAIQPKKAD